MTDKPDRLITSAMVRERTSLSRTTLWRLVTQAQFPPPVQISVNRIAWSEQAIADWIAGRVAKGER
jgi:prophage regulatory protein